MYYITLGGWDGYNFCYSVLCGVGIFVKQCSAAKYRSQRRTDIGYLVQYRVRAADINNSEHAAF